MKVSDVIRYRTCSLPFFLGHSELSDELQKIFKKENINRLCKISPDGSCNILCFSSAKPLEPYLEQFIRFSVTYPSDLFNKFWQDKLSEIGQTRVSLIFQQVIDFVWTPVLGTCERLLVDLQSWKIKLFEVDRLFQNRYCDQKLLSRDLKNLYRAVSECQEKKVNDFKWIKGVIDRIWQYWELCNYHEAAQAFINIRDALGLTGDFGLVERVAKQVMCL